MRADGSWGGAQTDSRQTVKGEHSAPSTEYLTVTVSDLATYRGFPGGTSDAGDTSLRHEFDPWVRKTPWRTAWQATPVFLPGESHGQRILAGYRPWDRRVGHNLTQLTHSYLSPILQVKKQV